MADYLLECGELSLRDVLPGKMTVPERISQVQRGFKDRTGKSLEIMIYSSCGTANTGGRKVFQTMHDMRESIHTLNINFIPFNLALNGSLTNKEPRLDGDEKSLLSLLASRNRTLGIGNAVTILHPKIFDEVKGEYPELVTFASCVQLVDPNTRWGYGAEGYRNRLKDFDYVVMLPQHTTFATLDELSDVASRLVIFPTLKCGHGNLHSCYKHYVRQEAFVRGAEAKLDIVEEKDFPKEIRPSQDYAAQGCYDCGNTEQYPLLLEREDFPIFVQKGIRAFKVARDFRMQVYHLDTLMRAVITHSE